MKNKILCLIFISFIAQLCYAQPSIIGVWKTIDDVTGKAKSHVEFYQKNNKIYGKVIELLPGAATTVCNNCPGEKNGKSLLGMDIIWEMTATKESWSNGQIIDPKTGKIYSCTITRQGDVLTVRGYIGFSLLGRSQTWYKV